MYESGLLIAFLVWITSLVLLMANINSQMERNLNKIGMRLSWLNLKPKKIEDDELVTTKKGKFLKFLLIGGIGLPFLLFSWLYVAGVIGQWVYAKAKDSGAPQTIKEFRWRMRNLDLSREQVAEEFAKISTEDENTRQKIKAELLGIEIQADPAPPT